jgi:hypothetical protein
VLLVSFEIEPAKTPIPMNGMIAPKQNTKSVKIKVSGSSKGIMETKMGAMQGSRK